MALSEERFNELLAEAKGGVPGAQEELFTCLAGDTAEAQELLAIVRKLMPRGDRMRDFAESIDLVQTALRSGWLDLGQFRGSTKGEFLAWLRTIIRHKLSQQVRKKKARILPGETQVRAQAQQPDGNADPVAEAVRKEVADRIREALPQLPDNQQEVMSLVLQGRSSASIAEQLGLDPTVVRKRKSRAAATLKSILSRE